MHKTLPDLTPPNLSNSSPTVPQSSVYVPTQQTPSASPVRTVSGSSSPGASPNFQVQVKCPNTGLPFHPLYNNIKIMISPVSTESYSSFYFMWPRSYKMINEYIFKGWANLLVALAQKHLPTSLIPLELFIDRWKPASSIKSVICLEKQKVILTAGF